MPSEYECESCKLSFSVGWFHYHGHDGGCWSQTLLVCTSCGTVHSVEHPVADSGVAERIKVQPGPVIDPTRFFGRASHYRDWADVAFTDGRELEELRCMHCQSTKTLRKNWPALGAPCPKCGEMIRDAGSSWMT